MKKKLRRVKRLVLREWFRVNRMHREVEKWLNKHGWYYVDYERDNSFTSSSLSDIRNPTNPSSPYNPNNRNH